MRWSCRGVLTLSPITICKSSEAHLIEWLLGSSLLHSCTKAEAPVLYMQEGQLGAAEEFSTCHGTGQGSAGWAAGNAAAHACTTCGRMAAHAAGPSHGALKPQEQSCRYEEEGSNWVAHSVQCICKGGAHVVVSLELSETDMTRLD